MTTGGALKTTAAVGAARSALALGIDLGGTKTEAAVLDDAGAIVWRRRVATPQGDYDGTLATVCTLVRAAEAEVGTRGLTVGIGTPGSATDAGLIRNANSTCLNGRPLQADLERRLQRPLRLANDANCLALSEATDGAAAGAGVVFAVILGTGVGGGIVAHGRLLAGANGLGGEWGHNPLPWADAAETAAAPACYCGRRGCVETWLSGPGLARDHAAHADLPGADGVATSTAKPSGIGSTAEPDSVDSTTRSGDDSHGVGNGNGRGIGKGPGDGGTDVAPDAASAPQRSLTAAQIAVRAAAGDAACETSLCRYEERLARALAGVINLLDPDAIVLGGGLSHLDRLYTRVPALWGRHVFSAGPDRPLATRLLKNRHGDASGVRGAAWLWKEDRTSRS